MLLPFAFEAGLASEELLDRSKGPPSALSLCCVYLAAGTFVASFQAGSDGSACQSETQDAAIQPEQQPANLHQVDLLVYLALMASLPAGRDE